MSSEVSDLAIEYAEKHDCDVLFYSGEIEDEAAEQFVRACCAQSTRRKNVLLILVTPGGDAAAAYRIARCLQRLYRSGKFRIFVSGWCKSAGTLLAIGSHEIIIGDLGELGPLDVQLGKADELFEYNSGLTIDAALDALERRAMAMFETYFLRIKLRSGNRITFKTATTIASNMVSGLLSPVYGQIDPTKIGENAREMSLASDYGKRLNEYSDNLQSRRSLDILVESYCSHGFVIDRKEARGIFKNIGVPDECLKKLETKLGNDAYIPERDPQFAFLSKPTKQGEGHESSADASSSSEPGGEEGPDAQVIRPDFG